MEPQVPHRRPASAAVSERGTVTRKAECAAVGVPEYCILHPAPEHLAFFARTAAGGYLPLVPKTLRHDPVYADFVLPG